MRTVVSSQLSSRTVQALSIWPAYSEARPSPERVTSTLAEEGISSCLDVELIWETGGRRSAVAGDWDLGREIGS